MTFLGIVLGRLAVRCAVAAAICGATLAACGSAKTSHDAEINAALRRLQAEFEHPRPVAVPRGAAVLGTIRLFRTSPPKGVSAAEWQTAMKKDQPLQRAILASK